MPRSADELSDDVLRVVLARGIGPVTFDRLIDRFDSFEAITGAGVAALRDVEGVGDVRSHKIRNEMDNADVDAERALMTRHGVGLVMRGDSDYPPLLAAIPDPPVALWMRGELRDGDQAGVAMVGARACTAYGREQAGRLAALLAQSGLAIVSGGARGIDGEAHRGAVRVGGRTIVVCGCGLSRCYPPEHADLFDRIAADHGALVSEYPMATKPLATNFPRRNRIISGLSLGVVVIEAGRGSGALITARSAAEDHNREVMALPGRVDSAASRGCLLAIKEGWAALVMDHADVISQLESSSHLLRGAFEQAFGAVVDGEAGDTPLDLSSLGLTDGQRRIVDALADAAGPLDPDTLGAAAQLPAHELMAELTVLQIRRLVARDERGIRLASRRASE